MSKKRFDEAWLKEYQERTGCKAVQTGGIVAPDVHIQIEDPFPNTINEAEGTQLKLITLSIADQLQGKDPGTQKPRKYGNEPVTHEGKRFDSKHEARVYEQLRLSGLAGAHVGLARQVCFFLPGGVRYYADFVTLHADGSYRVIDAKSAATRKNAVYRLKKRQMKACLGLDIEEV